MAHSVATSVDATLGDRNRVTTAFRPILAIPHVVLAGPNIWSTRGGGVGLPRRRCAYVLAVVSWFTLLVKGEQFEGIREFCCYYLRWRTRALSYLALFRDEYPPFGDASLYAFGVGVMQWTLRVEAYLLLLVDDYPPFQLE